MTEQALASFCDQCDAAVPELQLKREVLVAALGALTPAQETALLDARKERLEEFSIAVSSATGDDKALALLEARYIRRLPRALSHMKLSDDRVDEVLQQVREKLLVGAPPKIAKYAGKGSLMGLLRVTATRAAISALRKEHRVGPGDEPVLDPQGSWDEEAAFLKASYRRAFKAAFEAAVVALDRRERNLLRLHFLGRVTLEQLATMYGVHRATIVRQLKRVRLKIEKSTRGELIAALQVSGNELDSVMDLIRSRLDVSVERVLATMEEVVAAELAR